jgi:hypothetical protein
MSAAHANPLDTAETPFVRARAHVARVGCIFASDAMKRTTHSELEEMLDGHGKEWARLMLDEILRLRAEVERKNAVVAIGTLHSALCTTAFVMRRLQTSMKR